MADLDELSIMLGGIQSDVAHVKTSTDAINVKVDRSHEKIIKAEQAASTAHKRIDELNKHINESIKPHIDDYRNEKQQGIGRNSVIALVFGFLGSLLMIVFKGFF